MQQARQGDRSERQGHAFARRSRARLRGGDVEGRRRQQGSRHGDRRDQAGPGDPGDDGQAAYGQRPGHRPWRLHLPAGGFDLCLCLQLPQRTRRCGAMQYFLHQAGQARRPPGRDRAGNLAQRAIGIYDVRVTAGDVVIAEFRGHSRTIGGAWLPETGTAAK